MLSRFFVAVLLVSSFTSCVSSLRGRAAEAIPLFPVAVPETVLATVRLTVIDRRVDGNLPIHHQAEVVITTDVASLVRNRVELALANNGVGVSTGPPLGAELTVELLEYEWDWQRETFAHRASADVKLKVSFLAATGEERWNTVVTGSADQLEKDRESGSAVAEQLEVALANAMKSAQQRGIFTVPAMNGTPPSER